MTDIQRALDKQARLDAEATSEKWEYDEDGFDGTYDLSVKGKCDLLAEGLSEPDAALIAHLRNQAQLARDVIAAVQRYESEISNPVPCHIMRSQFRKEMFAALQAWADHVNKS